jgi:outer membrane lipoprotein carrier protein
MKSRVVLAAAGALGGLVAALTVGGARAGSETPASETTGGGAPEAARVVAALQARYDATSSFEAAFKQQIELVALGQQLESWGVVYYRRPGRMRWEFAGPEKQTVVADGRILWMYQEAQRQVVKIELADAFQTSTPLSFLIGLGKLADDFDAQLAPGSTPARPALLLRPRAPGDVGALELHLSPSYDIIGALVTDAMGGTTRWSFSDLRRNAVLGDELFDFAVPDGVDVVVPPSRF